MIRRLDGRAAGLAALVLVAFLPSLNLPLLVVNELTIIGNALHAGRDGWWGWFQWSSAYYRPLIFPLYLAPGLAGGLRGWPFHALLIAMHLAATLWVYALGRRLAGGPLGAAVGAAWFAVTWLKYENVVWGGGLESVAGSGLAMLALTLHRSVRPAVRWLALPVLCAMLLLYQVALLLPAILWWMDRRLDADRAGRWRLYALAGLASAGWVAAARFMGGTAAFSQTLPQVGSVSPLVWLEQAIRNVASLFGYLYAPWDSLSGAGPVLKYVLGFLTLGALARLARRGSPWERVAGGGALLVAAPILMRTLVEPRYGYLISAAVCPLLAGRAVAFARARLPRWGRRAAAVAFAGAVLLSVQYQWRKAREHRLAGERVWAVIGAMRRDIPSWPKEGLVVEGLPLWEDRSRLPVPLFGNDLAPTVRVLYRDLDARAWHAWESGVPEGVPRVRFAGDRFLPEKRR